MPSQKTFRTKRILAKASRQNRPIPQWFRLKTDTKIQVRSETFDPAMNETEFAISPNSTTPSVVTGAGLSSTSKDLLQLPTLYFA
ncbi:hypothetical protein D9619_011530 [Psilocybe cf. subviscida]|uniref:Large ribosomal subunit protein eL39 n=1 Tax=Psilocybe cf. subviscida TaxID=2480587 RepID=A0A8H5BU92_9AGAR|nr:hypothetical protein D9619_011530 [Psilocybe cf. subviscida]